MNNEPQLDSLLKQMAERHRPDLPSPGLIWWRAQILKKYDQKRRIERPIRLMRLAATAACFMVVAALMEASREWFQAAGHASWLILPIAVVALTAWLVASTLLWPAAKRR
jgi:hypothetical protein